MSGKSKCISITHFINPHLFWFHDDDDGEILDLEAKLELIERRNIPKPEIGTLVAVRYLAWNKLIRARVDVAFKKELLGSEFIMWAIDYGFPFSTNSLHVFQLPKSLRTLSKCIHVAGLVGTFPAEKRLPFKSTRLETHSTEKWCKYACDWMENKLTEAETVEVMRSVTDKDHVWVELQVTTNLGEKFNIREQLIKMQLAIDAGRNLNYTHLDTTKIAPWFTNEGFSKFRKNVAINYSGNTVKNKGGFSKEISNANCTEEEWSERTVNISRKAEESDDQGKAALKEYYEQVADKEGNNKIEFTSADLKDEQNELTLRHVFRKGASSQEPRKQLSERMQHIMEDRRCSVELGARGDSGIGDCPSAQTQLGGGSNGQTKPMDKPNEGKTNTETSKKIPWHVFSKKASSQEPTKQLSERMQRIIDRCRSVKLGAPADSGIGDYPSAQTRLDDGSKIGCAKPNKGQPSTETAKKASSSFGFDNVRMIPAGFDMNNLRTYKNEETHWHRKATTLNDYVPHDDNLLRTNTFRSVLKTSNARKLKPFTQNRSSSAKKNHNKDVHD